MFANACVCLCVFAEYEAEIKRDGDTLANTQRQADVELEINTTALYFTVPNGAIWLKFSNGIAEMPDF